MGSGSRNSPNVAKRSIDLKHSRTVPRRSNVFQEVVAIIHRHVAGDAEVEESAMLLDRLTGKRREVDVVITTQAAGFPLTISVEATSQQRPMTVEWLERMVAKHEHLATDKLVLVAEGGFAKGVRKAAEARGAVALAPEDLTAREPALEIVSRLRSLWPKEVSFSPRSAKVVVKRPERDRPMWFKAFPDTLVVLEDGSELGRLVDVIASTVQSNFTKIAEQIGLAKIETDIQSEFILQVGSLQEPWQVGVDGTRRNIFARYEEQDRVELHPILAVRVEGDTTIHVSKVALRAARLGEVAYSYGQGELGGRPVLVVVTEDELGRKIIIRTPDT
jgi:hypothetical protein